MSSRKYSPPRAPKRLRRRCSPCRTPRSSHRKAPPGFAGKPSAIRTPRLKIWIAPWRNSASPGSSSRAHAVAGWQGAEPIRWPRRPARHGHAALGIQRPSRGIRFREWPVGGRLCRSSRAASCSPKYSPAPSAPRPAGIDDDALESLLEQAEITGIEDLDTGITKPQRVTLRKDGVELRAVFKQLSTDFGIQDRAKALNESDRFEYELAAYKLDRLLGLDMVPVTVLRTIKSHRERCSSGSTTRSTCARCWNRRSSRRAGATSGRNTT